MGSSNLILIIAGVVLVGMLGVMAILKNRFTGGKAMPYGKIHILSEQEKQFYRLLLKAFADDDLVIETKVMLADIVAVGRVSQKNRQKYFQRIARDHADFVALDKKNLEPVFVVELKDQMHRSSDSRKREEFHKALFQHIQIPCFMIDPAKTEDADSLRARILEGLGIKA